jgi:hypothetical protein
VNSDCTKVVDGDLLIYNSKASLEELPNYPVFEFFLKDGGIGLSDGACYHAVLDVLEVQDVIEFLQKWVDGVYQGENVK